MHPIYRLFLISSIAFTELGCAESIERKASQVSQDNKLTISGPAMEFSNACGPGACTQTHTYTWTITPASVNGVVNIKLAKLPEKGKATEYSIKKIGQTRISVTSVNGPKGECHTNFIINDIFWKSFQIDSRIKLNLGQLPATTIEVVNTTYTSNSESGRITLHASDA